MSFEIPREIAALAPSSDALDRLVYLIGPARGGTSIIHRSMNVHPNTLVLPNVSYFMQRVWRYRNKVHERLLHDILRMPGFWDNNALRSRLSEEQYSAHRQLVNAALASRDLAQLYKLYPLTYSLTGASGKDPGAVKVWHDKQNDWRYLDPLAKAFPKAKFIFVMRDPRSVALSGSLRVSAKAGEVAEARKRDDVVNVALYWRFLSQRCLDFAKGYPGRAIFVRFEDFMTSPVETMNRVFSFTMDAPMEEAALRTALATVRGGGTNVTSEYTGVSTEPLARWKEALGAQEIDMIEVLTAPTARKLGYDIERPDGAFAMLRRLREVGGRAAAKALLCEGYDLKLGSTAAEWPR